MNDYDLIRDFNNDENVIKLKNYYNSLSSMEILGVDRREIPHSNFLKWMFDSKHNYDLGTKPLMLLLNLLIQNDVEHVILVDTNDKNNITLRKANISLKGVFTEYPLGEKQKYGRADIYISFSIENNEYAIVLENKVESSENRETRDGSDLYQTEKYFNYFSNLNDGIKYIYVFLAPVFNGERVTAQCKNFINISYDDIVKFIIKPLLFDENLPTTTRYILEDYLKVLSKPNVISYNSKSISMLSFKEQEKENELIESIKSKHEQLGKKLESVDENEILSEFRDDSSNEIIIASVWPNAMSNKNRNKNVTFAKLGIEPGTVLYLASKEKGIEKVGKTVTTVDFESKVIYEFAGETRIETLSHAAGDLTGKGGKRGINWFIYNDGKRDINLFKYNEEISKDDEEK